jgi:hypothetical protein
MTETKSTEATLALFTTADGRIGVRLHVAEALTQFYDEVDAVTFEIERGAPWTAHSMAEIQDRLHGDLRLRLKHGAHPAVEQP